MFPRIGIPSNVLNVHSNGFLVDFEGIKSFSNKLKLPLLKLWRVTMVLVNTGM